MDKDGNGTAVVDSRVYPVRAPVDRGSGFAFDLQTATTTDGRRAARASERASERGRRRRRRRRRRRVVAPRVVRRRIAETGDSLKGRDAARVRAARSSQSMRFLCFERAARRGEKNDRRTRRPRRRASRVTAPSNDRWRIDVSSQHGERYITPR